MSSFVSHFQLFNTVGTDVQICGKAIYNVYMLIVSLHQLLEMFRRQQQLSGIMRLPCWTKPVPCCMMAL